MISKPQSIAFHTLGCKLNYSETSTLSRRLESDGFQKKEFEETADVYVINTCSVTDNADKECRYLVRKIQRRAPGAVVVIIGCYAQLKPKEISEIEGVDLVLGAAEKFNLSHHLQNYTRGISSKVHSCEIGEVAGFESSYSIASRTRTFLKVQDGCDYNCSFCTIPLARGHSRSDTINGVMANVHELALSGTKEIVLTGINLGDFGKGNEGGKVRTDSFYDLLQLLDSDSPDEIARFRISSIEPNLLTNEIIALVSTSRRIMPHFHIPLQSGSNAVLSKMRRRYRRELYQDRVLEIKSLMPHCCIGADVIVGFPGEGEAEFQETYDFLDNLPISYLHAFTYSERPNTLAIDMDSTVPPSIRHERNRLLRQLSHSKLQQHTSNHRGESRPVLWEKSGTDGVMEGYTDNYIRVQQAYVAGWRNTIRDWII